MENSLILKALIRMTVLCVFLVGNILHDEGNMKNWFIRLKLKIETLFIKELHKLV